MKIAPTLQIIGPMSFDYSMIEANLETIIVDGGLNHKLNLKGRVTSIGDNDSNLTNRHLTYPLNKDKDFSDLSGALALSASHNQINLYGFLNGRKDHEFANLLEAISILKTATLLNFENQIIVSNKEEMQFTHHGDFSLFCFQESKISIYGEVIYKLDKQKLRPFSSHGLSNNSSGEFKLINYDKNAIIIFLN